MHLMMTLPDTYFNFLFSLFWFNSENRMKEHLKIRFSITFPATNSDSVSLK